MSARRRALHSAHLALYLVSRSSFSFSFLVSLAVVAGVVVVVVVVGVVVAAVMVGVPVSSV